MVKKKKKILMDTPIQIGIAVYSYAKLALINFWEFLKDHLEDPLYQLMETDTDSLYIAIARDTLDDCETPFKRTMGHQKMGFLLKGGHSNGGFQWSFHHRKTIRKTYSW